METATLKDLLPELTDADINFNKLKFELFKVVRSKRRNLECSQKEFAEYIGVSKRTISKIEDCNCNFKLKKIVDICDKLGLNVDISFTHK